MAYLVNEAQRIKTSHLWLHKELLWMELMPVLLSPLGALLYVFLMQQRKGLNEITEASDFSRCLTYCRDCCGDLPRETISRHTDEANCSMRDRSQKIHTHIFLKNNKKKVMLSHILNLDRPKGQSFPGKK